MTLPELSESNKLAMFLPTGVTSGPTTWKEDRKVGLRQPSPRTQPHGRVSSPDVEYKGYLI